MKRVPGRDVPRNPTYNFRSVIILADPERRILYIAEGLLRQRRGRVLLTRPSIPAEPLSSSEPGGKHPRRGPIPPAPPERRGGVGMHPPLRVLNAPAEGEGRGRRALHLRAPFIIVHL